MKKNVFAVVVIFGHQDMTSTRRRSHSGEEEEEKDKREYLLPLSECYAGDRADIFF